MDSRTQGDADGHEVLADTTKLAKQVAAVWIAQGWTMDPQSYDVDFDVGALEEHLGRASTREERLDFERQVRAELAAHSHRLAAGCSK